MEKLWNFFSRDLYEPCIYVCVHTKFFQIKALFSKWMFLKSFFFLFPSIGLFILAEQPPLIE